MIKEAFLDTREDDVVSALHNPVGLGVVNQSKHEFGSYASTEFLEQLRVELLTIVYRELFRYPESAYDVLPEKFSDCLGGYIYQGLSFYPFGEVLNGHNCILVVSLGGR